MASQGAHLFGVGGKDSSTENKFVPTLKFMMCKTSISSIARNFAYWQLFVGLITKLSLVKKMMLSEIVPSFVGSSTSTM